MSSPIESIERRQLRRVPDFAAGDRVKVHFQIVEGNRSRTQVFEGIVIRRQGAGARETFTVRKQSFGVGVERTFPMHSPRVERIEVIARGEVRRAKLYYLRGRIGRRARVRERRYMGEEELEAAAIEELAEGEAAAAEEGAEETAEQTVATGEEEGEPAPEGGADAAGEEEPEDEPEEKPEDERAEAGDTE